ncbi:hypothetical protein M758_1G097700 [Ceratodon purpureus]|uniref:Galactose oxidase n=1 Tax=Ceratodon purpureus TaxID=3225 RepID=A0A8T0J6L3_CERPU|nr:hypothetical protein KC19_1G108300 [Ceratodon purpureus]KAG0629364.1 hypothetical protein M758_1G097700 [Ceratodon purpureus]
MGSKFKMLTLSILGILSCVGGLGRVEAKGAGDSWELVVSNAGVSAMHMALHHTNRVIMFDRTDYGPSQIKLPGGYCRNDNKDLALKVDCWAHSIDFDLASSTIRPLTVLTDTWCSSGAFQADGSLTQTGGWNDGGMSVRKIGFAGGDDWKEYPGSLAVIRWYATNQILPDGRQIVIGGRRQFNYEFVPRNPGEGVHGLPLLAQTSDPGAENNLYPFVHLSTDGNLFIFANQDSIMFNYKTGTEVRRFPRLAGGPRNYPSSGSSVLLPITAADGYKAAEVMICGGAPAGSFQNVGSGKFAPALQTCGRLVITATNPQWQIENMPSPRVMGDMLILPTGEILIINGAKYGTAGWGVCREPALAPVLYNPGFRRFQEMATTTIPRLYHSTALVLPDGKVLVAGSNPNQGYSFAGVMYPTELRIEKYSPYYLNNGYNFRRPQIVLVDNTNPKYGAAFKVTFKVASALAGVAFHLYAPPFVTHTYSMNQRMLILGSTAPAAASGQHVSTITAPPNAVTAPAGYYLLTVINGGTPSVSTWVHVG